MLVKECPKCKTEMTYKNKASFIDSVKEGRLCRQCCGSKSTIPLPEGVYSKIFDNKLTWGRNCPNCKKEIWYKNKQDAIKSFTSETLCRSCSSALNFNWKEWKTDIYNDSEHITCVLFDLDGVLVESTKNLHFQALNKALCEVGISPISNEEHEEIFNGLPTSDKLKLLCKWGRIKEHDIKHIENIKQNITMKMLDKYKLTTHPKLRRVLYNLKKNKNLKLGVVTNSVRETTMCILGKLRIVDMFDIIVTNEDVKNRKPQPDAYLFAMEKLQVPNKKCIIIEDSKVGVEAGLKSGAFVWEIDGPKSLGFINTIIYDINVLINLKKFNQTINNNIVWHIKKIENRGVCCTLQCQTCGILVWKYISGLKEKIIDLKTFTGNCDICNSQKHGKAMAGKNNPKYKGKYKSCGGYVTINLLELPEEDKTLCAPMAVKRSGSSEIVLEHRFIMAKHLGRPLEKHEIVHHKNGIRTDNRIENLELLTTKTHHAGHGDFYYQKWQEAESKIKELEEKIKQLENQ